LVNRVRNLHFPKQNVFTPGSGTNESVMGWLSTLRKRRGPAFTGKPQCLRGVNTAFVEALVIIELIRVSLARQYFSLRDKRIAVQGYVAFGGQVARMCYEAGAHVVAVADISGGLLDPQGMHPHSLDEHIKREGVLLGYLDAQSISNDELLECECDVLVLAAGPNQITSLNAERIKASLVIEATPGALNQEAEAVLATRDAKVIPLLLAGSGTPLAAALETDERNNVNTATSRQAAFVRRSIRDVEKSVHQAMQKWQLGMRESAITLGVEKVAAAIRAYGR
jgi:glutamate dehydrogenase/leucine dehydrogenase